MLYDREKERQREIREQKQDDRREERLLTTFREAQPAVPQTVTINNQKLPEIRSLMMWKFL